MEFLNKTKMKKILIIFLCVACKGYEPLIGLKESNNLKEIKSSGYYYLLTDRDMGYGYNTKIYDCFMIFQNGIYYNVMHGGYNPKLKKDSILAKIDLDIESVIKNQNIYTNTRPNWGIFKIGNSEIKIERWTFSSGGGTYPRQEVFGKILNDTTVNFYEQDRNSPTQYGKNKKKEKIDETYHFRQFSPKPDSTNKFIK